MNLWFKKKAESGDSLILAVVVSRKTEPLATNRNTWRRRIREVLRRKNFKAGNSFFLIIQVKKKGKISSSEEIEKEIFRLFREAGGEEV